jgi:DNA-directed RNA polymerase specialized sigma24 family protein
MNMTASEPGSASARPLSGTEMLESHALPEPVPAETRVDIIDADAAVGDLYGAHYRALVRLAVLLAHDTATAEGVVQDAFVAMYARTHRLRDDGEALSYLRAAVVRRSRPLAGHGVVADRNGPGPTSDMPSAVRGQFNVLDRSAVVAALRKLPRGQREAVVLRYYCGLSEAEAAATMGITPRAVKRHIASAMAALRSVLEREP